MQSSVNDDLDTVFGRTSQRPAQSEQSSDPFSLFGGLGTTEQAAEASVLPSIEDDFLGIQLSPAASTGTALKHSSSSHCHQGRHHPLTSYIGACLVPIITDMHIPTVREHIKRCSCFS